MRRRFPMIVASQVATLVLTGLAGCTTARRPVSETMACQSDGQATEYLRIVLPGDAGALVCAEVQPEQLAVRVADRDNRTVEYWAVLIDRSYWEEQTSVVLRRARTLSERKEEPCVTPAGKIVVVADGGGMSAEYHVGDEQGLLRRQAGGGEYYRRHCPDAGATLIEGLARELLTRANFARSRYCNENSSEDLCR